jgi:hypothetical protein
MPHLSNLLLNAQKDAPLREGYAAPAPPPGLANIPTTPAPKSVSIPKPSPK